MYLKSCNDTQHKENVKWCWSKSSKKSVHTEKRIAAELCAHYRNNLDYSAWVRTKRNLETRNIEILMYSVVCVSNSVIARHKEYTILKDVVFECLASQAYSIISCQSVVNEEQRHRRQAYVLYTCPFPLTFLWRGHHFRCSVCKMLHHKMPFAFSSAGRYGIDCTTEKFLNRCLED